MMVAAVVVLPLMVNITTVLVHEVVLVMYVEG